MKRITTVVSLLLCGLAACLAPEEADAPSHEEAAELTCASAGACPEGMECVGPDVEAPAACIAISDDAADDATHSHPQSGGTSCVCDCIGTYTHYRCTGFDGNMTCYGACASGPRC